MYDSEDGVEICISQLMKFKIKQTRHNKEIIFGFRFSGGVLFHCAVDIAPIAD